MVCRKKQAEFSHDKLSPNRFCIDCRPLGGVYSSVVFEEEVAEKVTEKVTEQVSETEPNESKESKETNDVNKVKMTYHKIHYKGGRKR